MNCSSSRQADCTSSFEAGELQDWLYRNTDHGCGLATIFNADDPSSYFNWRLKLGNNKKTKIVKRQPRFREMIDTEIKSPAFELTGEHDGSVYMVCPPQSDLVFAEELPYLNFIMNDLGGYSSIDIFVTDEKGDSRIVRAKNFISRTCIAQTKMDIPMRLRPSWNYACLDLAQLMKDAWNKKYQNVRLVKINANFRMRRIFFSDRIYSYDELPKEFQMNINLATKTQLKIIDFEKAFPANVQELYLNLRPSVCGKRSLPLLNYNAEQNELILTEEQEAAREKEIAIGLKLSLPSNHELLSAMMSKSIRYRPDAIPSILWKYPKSEMKLYRGAVSGKPTQEDTTSFVKNNTNADIGKSDWPKDFELNEPQQDFCDYIWKSMDDGQSGEWEKIESSNVQPQIMAKIHKQRRGEGLYDIYNARMVHKDDAEYFGFGDNDEELKLIMKRKSEKTDKSQGKLSFADKSGDWDFLNYVVSGTGINEDGSASVEGKSDNVRSVGTDSLCGSSKGSSEAYPYSLTSWNRAAIPSKPMQDKGTGAFYHICFDSKALPFQK